jgi:hypothetical protein
VNYSHFFRCGATWNGYTDLATFALRGRLAITVASAAEEVAGGIKNELVLILIAMEEGHLQGVFILLRGLREKAAKSPTARSPFQPTASVGLNG